MRRRWWRVRWRKKGEEGGRGGGGGRIVNREGEAVIVNTNFQCAQNYYLY